MTFTELYPADAAENAAGGCFSVHGGYSPILAAIGQAKGAEIVIQVDDADYSGDSRVLYKSANEYGYLNFGWGSCSGCDALEGCETPAEVEELAAELAAQVKWLPAEGMGTHFRNHDWNGDYSANNEAMRCFIRDVCALLGVEAPMLFEAAR